MNIFSCCLSTDTHVPNIDAVMSKARKIIEYFNKSTQQNAKLLQFQKDSTLAMYSAPGFWTKKLLQDVITRWWSSYRMLTLEVLEGPLDCFACGRRDNM